MANPVVAPVKGRGVTDIEMAHELGEIGPLGSDQQMEMIVHQHVGMELDLINAQGILELGQKHLTVGVVAVDRFALIATAGDVKKTAGQLDA